TDCSNESYHYTRTAKSQALTDDESEDRQSTRAEGHADADLRRALTHARRNDAVQTHSSQHRRNHTKDTNQHQRETRGVLGLVDEFLHRLHLCDDDRGINLLDGLANQWADLSRIAAGANGPASDRKTVVAGCHIKSFFTWRGKRSVTLMFDHTYYFVK